MKRFLKEFFGFIRRTDLFLLVVALAASCYGLVLIRSATLSYHSDSYVVVQSAAIVIGIVIYFIISAIDFEPFCKFWPVILIINLLLIASLLVFGVGEETTGNRSWIRFDSIGLPVGIQPAEIGKILFVISLSSHAYRLRERINSFFSILQLGVHTIIMFLAVYLFSKDLGMAIMYLFIFLGVMFAAGVSVWWFALFGGCVGVALPIAWKFVLSNYQKQRIIVAFNPELDPLKYGYHAIQSKIALGSGGMWGLGLGNGTQTQNSILPAKHTDFIFSVAGEELGLAGCTLIILLLTTIIIACIVNAVRAANKHGTLICFGVASMLFFQIAINIGMCVALTPVIGLTLPFFSYGGTSILSMFAAIGLVSGVKAHPQRLRPWD